jgi:hypothetical protein
LKDINENLESVSKKDMLDFLNFESLLEKIDELNKE